MKAKPSDNLDTFVVAKTCTWNLIEVSLTLTRQV